MLHGLVDYTDTSAAASSDARANLACVAHFTIDNRVCGNQGVPLYLIRR
jgi:hypothetical protein